MAGPPIPYQVKKRKLFQTKLKNYLKNEGEGTSDEGEFISGIFTRDKKDIMNGWHWIMDIKAINGWYWIC